MRLLVQLHQIQQIAVLSEQHARNSSMFVSHIQAFDPTTTVNRLQSGSVVVIEVAHETRRHTVRRLWPMDG